MFNVLGVPIDGTDPKTFKSTGMDVIHKPAPDFTSLSQKAEMLET